jgi:LCP family protein required for cell wall assembly
MWKRFLLAGVLITLFAGAATATAGLLEVDDVRKALSQNPRLDVADVITPAEAGKPQTILLLGSDKRRGAERVKGFGLSDTMILVRLNPNKRATALLSIPRDLKVTIRNPKTGGVATDKINMAYHLGGPKLTTKTISETMGIDINHVVNISFVGFRAAVNFIGCVYTDIDRRYFNDNSGPGPLYATIDVQAGYQKLCGQDALDYVRFRHEDTDLVRAARQQQFLGDAKDQLAVRELLGDRKELARLLGKYTQTDIHSTSEVLRLMKLVIFSAGQPQREVRFRAELGPSYVEASKEMIRETRKEFLEADASEGPKAKPPQTPAQREAARRRKKQPQVAAGLENAENFGVEQAAAIKDDVSFPIYYPKLRTQGSVYVDVPRAYTIRNEKGKRFAAYRMVLNRGYLGEYYGIQATTWQNPPILAKPSGERTVRGRRLLLFYDGNRLRLVAWRTKRAVYWVSNTLVRTLTNRQMIDIARSLQPYRG